MFGSLSRWSRIDWSGFIADFEQLRVGQGERDRLAVDGDRPAVGQSDGLLEAARHAVDDALRDGFVGRV